MTVLGIVAMLMLSMVYVLWPLLKPSAAATQPAQPLLPCCVVDGVNYGTEAEWAIERVLGRAGEGEPDADAAQQRAALAAELERRVEQVRHERRSARMQKGRVLCSECGRPFGAGDRYCARCGEPHPSVCRRCGERHRPDDRYCSSCGLALPSGGRS